jgi:signal transduction histidine kinase/CheY-like chemotaxis protein
LKTFRLRTKFLLSLVAISTGLMATTLLAVRYSVQRQVRASIADDLRNSASTFVIFEQQRDATLSRSAELLANLPNVRALMTTHDVPTIQDASADLWRLSGSDVMVLADPDGTVMSLSSHSKNLTRPLAQGLIRQTLQREAMHDWWFGGGSLYEVWLQPIHFGTDEQNTPLGFIAVGHEINDQTARDVKNVAASEVLFSYGGIPVTGTLDRDAQNGLRDDLQVAPEARNALSPHEIQIGEENYLVTTVRLSSSGDSGPQVTLTVLKSFDKASAFLGQLNRVLVGLGLLTLVAGTGLVFLISDTFTRPLANLVAGVRALEKGDFSYPLPSRGSDEVAEVTTAFSTMRATLKQTRDEQKLLEERLRQAHKMEAVGRLAGGVAHDFNNLLTIIRGHTDLLLDSPTTGETQRHSIEQIRGAADRAVSMTRQLLAFSRMQVLQPRVLDLNAVIIDMGKMLPRLIGADVEFSFVAENKQCRVKADPGQIEQVVMNLAVNARDAMPDGGKLTVVTREMAVNEEFAAKHPPMSPGKYVLLSVADTGEGMDAEIQAHIFEPFFTTKELGKGTGLGLATVYGVVKQSGGFVFVESARGKGARFDIYLPLATEGIAAVFDSRSSSPPSPRGSETVLVAEDEAGVRALACHFLRIKGYTVLEASDGAEALKIIQQHHQPIHVVLSDMIMPKMGGIELAENVKNIAPETKIILMSGYYEYSNANSRRIAPSTLLLQKPFSPTSLVNKVREALTGESTAKPEDTAVRSLV